MKESELELTEVMISINDKRDKEGAVNHRIGWADNTRK